MLDLKLPFTRFWRCNPVNLHHDLQYFYLRISTGYNIVIMCVMNKHTRNRDNETACDNEWTRQRQHTFSYCTLSPHAPLHLQSSMHCQFEARHSTDACSPSCISVHDHSIQWTPLVVQSKRVSTRIRFEPPAKELDYAGQGPWYAARRTCCSNVGVDVLHCPRTLCEQLFPCLVYSTG